MYANLEEEFGLARHAMSVYDRATKAVADEDKFAIFALYISRATEFFGVTRTREIYERAIEVLPDKQAQIMCLRYAELETRLNEIDRARAVFTHGSQFADPRTDVTYWKKWHDFEVNNGNVDTFKELLRIRRSVQAQFNTQINFVANQMATSFVPAVDTKPVGGQIQRLETDMEALERLAQVQANVIPVEGAKVAFTKGEVTNPDAIELEGESESEEEEEEGDGTQPKKKKKEKDIELEEVKVPQAVFERNVPTPGSKPTGEGAMARLKRKRG